jgi:hypothetical protein
MGLVIASGLSIGTLFVVPAAYVLIARKTEVVTERLKKPTDHAIAERNADVEEGIDRAVSS